MSIETIKQAIQTKAIIEFGYNGHKRIVEPHVLGISKGDLQILGYQVGGTSKSGGVPEWRRFDLSVMTSLVITNQKFAGPRPFPSGKHSPWDQEIMIVSP